MGLRGKPPAPTRVLEARGSWRAKLNKGEPQDEVALPQCPDWLDEEGKAEWKRLAPLLKKRGTVSKLARGVLAGLCENWSLFVGAALRANEALKDGSDPLKVRRWSITADAAYRAYLRAALEFGLTPASKTRVRPGKVTKAKGEDGQDKAKFFRVG